jgi:lipocalin
MVRLCPICEPSTEVRRYLGSWFAICEPSTEVRRYLGSWFAICEPSTEVRRYLGSWFAHAGYKVNSGDPWG